MRRDPRRHHRIERRNRPAEQDALRVDHAAGLRQREGEVPRPVLADLDRARHPVAHLGEQGPEACLRRSRDRPVALQQVIAPDELFQLGPVLARHDQMADLAGEAVATAKELAVYDDAATDTALQHQIERDPRPGIPPPMHLADREGIRIVLHHHRHLDGQGRPRDLGKVHVAPAEQRCRPDVSPWSIWAGADRPIPSQRL